MFEDRSTLLPERLLKSVFSGNRLSREKLLGFEELCRAESHTDDKDSVHANSANASPNSPTILAGWPRKTRVKNCEWNANKKSQVADGDESDESLISFEESGPGKVADHQGLLEVESTLPSFASTVVPKHSRGVSTDSTISRRTSGNPFAESGNPFAEPSKLMLPPWSPCGAAEGRTLSKPQVLKPRHSISGWPVSETPFAADEPTTPPLIVPVKLLKTRTLPIPEAWLESGSDTIPSPAPGALSRGESSILGSRWSSQATNITPCEEALVKSFEEFSKDMLLAPKRLTSMRESAQQSKSE